MDHIHHDILDSGSADRPKQDCLTRAGVAYKSLSARHGVVISKGSGELSGFCFNCRGNWRGERPGWRESDWKLEYGKSFLPGSHKFKK